MKAPTRGAAQSAGGGELRLSHIFAMSVAPSVSPTNWGGEVQMDAVDLRDELRSVDLGDLRRDQRVLDVIAVLQAHPANSYMESMSAAGREGYYRLLRNAKAMPDALLKPHAEETARRANAVERCLVLHDTTEVSHGRGSARTDFYDLQNGRFGYLAHVSIAVSSPDRMALGTVVLKIIERKLDRVKVSGGGSLERWSAPDKESLRWGEGIELAAAKIPNAIHVMDREGDSYEILVGLTNAARRFIVRGGQDRKVIGDVGNGTTTVLAAMSATEPALGRTAALSTRALTRKKAAKAHPPREARVAKLMIAARQVTIQRPAWLRGAARDTVPASISLNAVHVREVEVPEGCKAVEWLIYTSEPITTAAEIAMVVDDYAARWTIEEFFKALKTGCDFERRQFESQKTSQTALALTLPVAWKLLVMRHLDRTVPDAPASVVLDAARLKVLRAIARVPIPPKATVHHVLIAVADLGGHQKNSGPPGWLTLSRGMERLETSFEAVQLVLGGSRGRSDQA